MPETIEQQTSILQNIAAARLASKDWHDVIETYRALYLFEQYKKQRKRKQNEVAYEDPTYANTVDLAVGILLGNRMDFRAFGWSPDAQEQKLSSKIEKYLNGVVAVACRREEYDVEYENIQQFVRDGASVLYTVWDPKIAASAEGVVQIADEEAGAREHPALLESPLRVQVVDPLKVNLLPGGPRRWHVITRDEEMDVLTAEQKFNVKIQKYSDRSNADKTSLKCIVTDYWELIEILGSNKVPVMDEAGEPIYMDDGEPLTRTVYEWRRYQPWSDGRKTYCGVLNAVLIDSEFIKGPDVMNGYEDLPYTVGFFKPVSRTATKDWGHGIIHPLRSSVELLSRAINRRAFQIDVFSDLPLMAIQPPGQNIQIDPGIARIVKMNNGGDLKFPTWPGNAPDFEEHINFLRGRVQQSGFADALMMQGASSGYALSQVGDENRIRLAQPVRHLCLQWSSWAEKVLRLTKTFIGDNVVRVYGRTRGHFFADYVSGDGMDQVMVDCLIRPEWPSEISRNHAFFVQTKGEVSRATRMERYLHIEQPDDEEDRLLAEQLAQDPAMRQYAIMRQLVARAANGDEAAALMLERLKSEAMPAEGGPSGPKPPQFSGVQSAEGMPTPQEAGGMPPGMGESEKLNTMINQAPGTV